MSSAQFTYKGVALRVDRYGVWDIDRVDYCTETGWSGHYPSLSWAMDEIDVLLQPDCPTCEGYGNVVAPTPLNARNVVECRQCHGSGVK